MNNRMTTPEAPNKRANILKKCLAASHALDLQGIIQKVGIEREAVVELLSDLVQKREVEVLCPVTVTRGQRHLTLHPLEHYRLVRPTDHDYLWQTRIRDNQIRIHQEAIEEWAEVPELSERTLDFSWIWPKNYAYSAS